MPDTALFLDSGVAAAFEAKAPQVLRYSTIILLKAFNCSAETWGAGTWYCGCRWTFDTTPFCWWRSCSHKHFRSSFASSGLNDMIRWFFCGWWCSSIWLYLDILQRTRYTKIVGIDVAAYSYQSHHTSIRLPSAVFVAHLFVFPPPSIDHATNYWLGLMAMLDLLSWRLLVVVVGWEEREWWMFGNED